MCAKVRDYVDDLSYKIYGCDYNELGESDRKVIGNKLMEMVEDD